MIRALSLILGALAASSIVAAQLGDLAIVPLAGTIRVIDTPWAAGGRLWAAAVLIVLATGLTLAPRSRRFAVVLGAGVFGALVDLSLSAWQWRVEKLSLLRDLGGELMEKQIRWEIGIVWLALAPIFVLAFTIATSYHRPPSLAQR